VRTIKIAHTIDFGSMCPQAGQNAFHTLGACNFGFGHVFQDELAG
jgi:hypothetical protein